MPPSILRANIATMGLNLLYAIAAMFVGLVALKLIDKYLFPQIDFIDEVKKGNIAAAILAAVSILFLAMVLSSALH